MASLFFRAAKNLNFLSFYKIPITTAPRPGGSFGGLAAGFSKSCVCLSSASFAFLRHSGRNPSSFFASGFLRYLCFSFFRSFAVPRVSFTFESALRLRAHGFLRYLCFLLFHPIAVIFNFFSLKK